MTILEQVSHETMVFMRGELRAAMETQPKKCGSKQIGVCVAKGAIVTTAIVKMTHVMQRDVRGKKNWQSVENVGSSHVLRQHQWIVVL